MTWRNCNYQKKTKLKWTVISSLTRKHATTSSKMGWRFPGAPLTSLLCHSESPTFISWEQKTTIPTIHKMSKNIEDLYLDPWVSPQSTRYLYIEDWTLNINFNRSKTYWRKDWRNWKFKRTGLQNSSSGPNNSLKTWPEKSPHGTQSLELRTLN